MGSELRRLSANRTRKAQHIFIIPTNVLRLTSPGAFSFL